MIYLQVFSLSSERYRAKVQKVKQEKVSRHRQRVSTLSDSVLPMYACTYLRVCVCVCVILRACMPEYTHLNCRMLHSSVHVHVHVHTQYICNVHNVLYYTCK